MSSSSSSSVSSSVFVTFTAPSQSSSDVGGGSSSSLAYGQSFSSTEASLSLSGPAGSFSSSGLSLEVVPSSVPVMSVTTLSVGNVNSGTITGVEGVNFDEDRPRKFAHLDSMDMWTGNPSGPRCKQSGSVLRPGILAFSYALQTHCLRCERCEEWVKTLSEVDKVMVGVISNVRGSLEDAALVVEDRVRAVAMEKVALKRREISIRKKIVKKGPTSKKFEKKARKMIEWEAEEDSGMESVDSMG